MARILAIGPHPDDVEIGMGGTILALPAERRAAEAAGAAHILGVGRRIPLPLPNRMLADTVENRMLLAGVIREVRPDLLFIPYWIDAHPDHVAACALAEAARFYAKLTKTEIPGEPFYPPPRFPLIPTPHHPPRGYGASLTTRPQAEAFVCREELGLRSLDGVV